MTNPGPSPLACDMSALAPDARAAHGRITRELSGRVSGVDDLPNGYGLRFPNESDTIVMIGEFISGERLCCPFLTFDLRVGARDESVSLSLTGPENVKEFLQAEFAEALQGS